MRISGRLATIATFVVAALLVYLVGIALLAAWPMWTLMGFGPAWSFALVAVVVGVGLIWALGRGRERTDDRPAEPAERCPRCGAAIESDYLLCPECQTALRAPCPDCGRSIKAGWSRCPYCGASTTGVPTATVGAAQTRSRGEPGEIAEKW